MRISESDSLISRHLSLSIFPFYPFVSPSDPARLSNFPVCWSVEEEEGFQLNGCCATLSSEPGLEDGVTEMKNKNTVKAGNALLCLWQMITEKRLTNNGVAVEKGKKGRQKGRPRKLQISSQSDGNEDKVICVKEKQDLGNEQWAEPNKILGVSQVEIRVGRSYDENGPHNEELKVKRKRGKLPAENSNSIEMIPGGDQSVTVEAGLRDMTLTEAIAGGEGSVEDLQHQRRRRNLGRLIVKQ
ncbi:hypothetical protein Rs2_48049 [Raphanus sativus]|nr:hypothetical protein Rs2_48049 [Raphanus sativus]